MKIDIKNLNFIDPTLRTIVNEFEIETGLEITITSLLRIDDKGVHGQLPLRGIDFRMKNMELGKLIENKLNEKWVYDPSRPNKKVAVFHDVGKGIHLHVQSHPTTVRK